MLIEMMKSKIHRVTVTEANLNYVGSITIDSDLLRAAEILPGQRVWIVNNNNGERFDTYVIEGEPGSGVICLNGAAARKAQPGDVVVIMTIALVASGEARDGAPVGILPGPPPNRRPSGILNTGKIML